MRATNFVPRGLYDRRRPVRPLPPARRRPEPLTCRGARCDLLRRAARHASGCGLRGRLPVRSRLRQPRRRSTRPAGVQLFESPQADAIIVSPDGTTLYVALTTMGMVRVINTGNLGGSRRIEVGTDPVSLALRPDGSELWVANHVSDSVSVISLAPGADAAQGRGDDPGGRRDEPDHRLRRAGRHRLREQQTRPTWRSRRATRSR